jgi:DNA-binding transcriptional LysR family regulator
VLPLVTAFLLEHPAVDVRLALGDRISHLMDEHVDVAVRIGTLPDSRLSAIGLGTLRQVVCASPAYLKAHGVPRKPGDLAAHGCIAFEGASSVGAWTFDGHKATPVATIHPRLVVNTAEAAVDAAVAGLGLTRVLSYQAEAARRAGRLQLVLEKFEPAKIPVNLVFDAQQRVTSKLRAFLDFAAPRLRKRLLELRPETASAATRKMHAS